MVFGAGGGIGHLAVQLAKTHRGRVCLLSPRGMTVWRWRNGSARTAVTNGRKDDIEAAARAFAPNGLDAALVTAGGEVTDRAPPRDEEGTGRGGLSKRL